MIKMKRIRKLVYSVVQPHGKVSFIIKNRSHGKTLLDVGCGNNSAIKYKNVRPDVYYIGLDVGDYNLSADAKMLIDEYHISSGENFHDMILKFKNTVDYVISANNMEHCNYPYLVLDAMLQSLRKGGYIYISYPSKESLHFPSRKGTLNFYDDPTHRNLIDTKKVLNMFEKNGVRCKKIIMNNRPLILRGIGRINEKKSIEQKKIKRGTWELWGFETIIWGEKV